MTTWTFYPTSGGEYDGTEGAARENITGSGHNYIQGDGADNDVSLLTFDYNAIRSALAGVTVTSITISFYVDYTVGTLPVRLWWGTHNYPTVPSTISFSRLNVQRAVYSVLGNGQVTNFALPNAVGNELRDGISTGLCIGPVPSGYSSSSNTVGLSPQDSTLKPYLTITGTVSNTPPNAPTLNTPAAGAVVDGTNTINFGWTHSDPQGDPMAAWYFRRNKGGGVYDYWNGSAFVATETRLTTATVSLPQGLMPVSGGTWANGNSYSWAVATEDPSGAKGPYSADRILYTSGAPTTTVTAPADGSTATTSRPTITWTFSDPDGQAQYGWHAVVVPQATYSDPGFSPDQAVNGSYSGTVSWTGTGTNSTATSATVSNDLTNHTTYRAYVQVASSPNPSAGLQWSTWVYSTFTVTIPPYAPVMTAPQNGMTLDLATAGFTLSWNDSFFSNIGSQTAFAIRRTTASGYQWWNGSWGSSEVFIPGSQTSYIFRAGEVANGVQESFSVAIRDDYGQTSPYASGTTVTGATVPTVTVLAPASVVVTSTPLVTWTMYQAENDPQQSYQVKILTSTQLGGTDPGMFDPTTVTATWDTGEVTDSGTRNVVVPSSVNLANHGSYVAYVRVNAGGIYSSWAYESFTISLSPPGTPTVTTMVDNDHAKIDVIFQGRDNMLSDVAARCVDGWMPMPSTGNCIVTQEVFLASAESSYMVQAKAIAAGSMMAHTMDTYPVKAGWTYTGAVTILAPVGTTAVVGYCVLHWLDSNGTIISSLYGQSFTDSSAVRSVASGVAPAGAVDARIGVQWENVANANDIHQFFDPVLRPSLGGEWSPGGLLGSTTATFTETVSGRPLRFGTGVPIPTDTQSATVSDEEAPIGATVIYGVTTKAVYPTATLTSAQALATPTSWTSGFLWLSDPLTPGSSYLFNPQKWGDQVAPTRQGKFKLIDRADALFVNGVRGLREGSFTIIAYTRADRDAFDALIKNNIVLLLRQPPDQGETVADAIYIIPQADAPASRPLDNRTTHRTIALSWAEQPMPMDNIDYVGGSSGGSGGGGMGGM